MRQRALIGALGLILVGVVLGATVFRADIAQATGMAQPQQVVVANTPLPVQQQGTANVNVTNSLSVASPAPITGGGYGAVVCSPPSGGGVNNCHVAETTATALQIGMTSGIAFCRLTTSDSVVASFMGPAFNSPIGPPGESHLQFALSRPITFDQIVIFGNASTDACAVSTIGNTP